MVKVRIEQGWLEGDFLEAVTGDIHYYSFKGIPYAEPPLGKLRFKAPQPPLAWDGTRSAKEHGAVCPQKDIFTEEIINGSEDCLYLNVYSPNIKPSTPLPVMVFIHGGGYKSGSGNIDNYGPDFLVNHGVVLVTINYRLEVLGFLCLDTEEVPGNAGLKDQVAALKWVNNNITHFGGDPQNITIFGESAGGASTCLHIISPMSKGLFKRAIPMSGTPLNDWSLPYMPQEKALKLCKQLGFETNDPNAALEFLQSVPVEKLVHTNPCVHSFEEANNNIIKMYHFTPVIEKYVCKENFLTEEPIKALKRNNINEVDVLIGYTNEEALVIASKLEMLIEHYSNYSDIIVPKKILINCSMNTIHEVSKRIHEFYFKGKRPSIETVREFIAYCNHATIINDIIRFTSHLPKVGNKKRFMYTFACISDRTVYGNSARAYGITGASHLDDLMYLFDAKKFNLKCEKNTKEYNLINFVCKVFTNFAKFGNPTPDHTLGVIWPEFDNINQNFVEIGDELTVKTRPEAEMQQFWKSIFEFAGIEY